MPGQEAGTIIPKDYLKILQENLSKRVQAVLKNQGGLKKY